MRDNDTLLREYVRDVLREDAMYGYSFVSKEELYGGFIEPFVDLFKTAVGKSKEVGRKARTLLTVGVETILTTLIPFYSKNYAALFDQEKKDIEAIRSEYRDVYERTNQVLQSSDAALLAFMASPAVFIGAKAASMAPKALKGILSATTGGLSDEVYDDAASAAKAAGRWALGDDPPKDEDPEDEDEDDEEERKRKKAKAKAKKAKAKAKSDGPRSMGAALDAVGESQINEDDVPAARKPITPKVILTNKKFLAKVLASPKAKKMQEEATKAYRTTLQQAYGQVETLFKKTKTVEDLERNLKGALKGDAQKKIEDIKSLPPAEKPKAEALLVKGIRDATKQLYVKNLTDHVEKVMAAGIPEESQFVKDYRETIQKIKALS